MFYVAVLAAQICCRYFEARARILSLRFADTKISTMLGRVVQK